MDSQSSTLREADVLCKCGEGWRCVITKTVGPDAGKAFLQCAGNSTCSIVGDVVKQEEGDTESGAYCNCGEGWSCVISNQPSNASQCSPASCTPLL